MTLSKLKFNKLALFASTLLFSVAAFAQGVEDVPPEVPEATGGFISIVFGGSIVDTGIWMAIFAVSFATLAFIIQGALGITRDKLLPEELIGSIAESLEGGNLQEAMETCEANPGPLSTILTAGFYNISEGFDVIQESIEKAADMETEKMMQQVNYLNICGQIAPMLGLMGTVTGMVSAFNGLATATGAAKAALLAGSISGALWTTCAGLIIAVPALLGYTFIKNNATRIILETEVVVFDLVKVLRNADVEVED